jgi:hypothetical protein
VGGAEVLFFILSAEKTKAVWLVYKCIIRQQNEKVGSGE